MVQLPLRKIKPSTVADTEEQRWSAVVSRDPAADGEFVYAVTTTKIYCRPSCPSRRPGRQNVTFFATADEASANGFRACKRCRPLQQSPDEAMTAKVVKVCEMLDESAPLLSLTELAAQVGISPHHLQRTFKAIVGLSPKVYGTAQRLRRTHRALAGANNVTSAIYDAGFNSSSRFYAAAPDALGMSPKSFRNGGINERIFVAVGQCSLGAALVAATPIGVCSVLLGDDPELLLRDLQDRFRRAEFIVGDTEFEQRVAAVFAAVDANGQRNDIPLDIRGTVFQRRVWTALQSIPAGSTLTYAQVAETIGQPKAVRAVARACAANPVAVIIPCHRVVRADGDLSGYRWGIDRKAALLRREGKHRKDR